MYGLRQFEILNREAAVARANDSHKQEVKPTMIYAVMVESAYYNGSTRYVHAVCTDQRKADDIAKTLRESPLIAWVDAVRLIE